MLVRVLVVSDSLFYHICFLIESKLETIVSTFLCVDSGWNWC